MASRLIMVMGVQRSGTGVFFHSLRHDERLTSFNENAHSPVFLLWHLRPEPEIRAVLEAIAGPVLLKPISETFRRSVTAVFEEYAANDVWVPWIYRDPVNVYYSKIQRWAERTDVPKFIRKWNGRNQSVLEALSTYCDRIGIVRYEDLIADPGVFDQVCAFFRIEGCNKFSTDSAGGRRHLPDHVITTIEAGTAAVLHALDAARRF